MKINLAGIEKQSIVDGTGLRFVIFAQGCSHACHGCHNPESHPFGIGKDYETDDLIKEIEKNPLLKGVTFSGGEPFDQARGFLEFAKRIKNTKLDIWCYTGYSFEDLMNSDDISKIRLLEHIDVLVDGRFQIDKRSLAMPYKGSLNQRIIDVKKSKLGDISQIDISLG